MLIRKLKKGTRTQPHKNLCYTLAPKSSSFRMLAPKRGGDTDHGGKEIELLKQLVQEKYGRTANFNPLNQYWKLEW